MEEKDAGAVVEALREIEDIAARSWLGYQARVFQIVEVARAALASLDDSRKKGA